MEINVNYTPTTSGLMSLRYIYQDLTELLDNNFSQHAFELLNELLFLDKRLHTLQENSAMGIIDEKDYNKEYNRIEKRIIEITTYLKLNYFIQGDPRGYTIYLSKNKIDQVNYNSSKNNSFPIARLKISSEILHELN